MSSGDAVKEHDPASHMSEGPFVPLRGEAQQVLDVSVCLLSYLTLHNALPRVCSHTAVGNMQLSAPVTSYQPHRFDSFLPLFIDSPATSTMSPGTMSRARTLWTLFLSCRYTFPISGSYSFSASMAFSALRSWQTQNTQLLWVSLDRCPDRKRNHQAAPCGSPGGVSVVSCRRSSLRKRTEWMADPSPGDLCFIWQVSHSWKTEA